MIEHPNVDQRQRRFERLSEGFVSPARLAYARRVVVRQDRRTGVDGQRRSHHFPRVDARPIDGTGEKLLAIEDPVAVVQPQDVKLLVKKSTQAHAKKVVGIGWIADAALTFKPSFQDAFGRGENVLLCRFVSELVASVGQ